MFGEKNKFEIFLIIFWIGLCAKYSNSTAVINYQQFISEQVCVFLFCDCKNLNIDEPMRMLSCLKQKMKIIMSLGHEDSVTAKMSPKLT